MQGEVGSIIKQLRRSKGMTLKELGDKAQLSVSYLSTLERNLCSVSLISLQNIANALDVDSNMLIMPSEEKKNALLRSYNQVPLRLDGSTRIYRSLIGEGCERPQEYDPLYVTLLPCSDIENVVPYSHSGEEFLYVLEGVLTLFLNERRYDLRPGESAHFMATTPHEWVNCTDKLVKLLSITTDRSRGEIRGGEGEEQEA